jgi:tetratricopeptide (TPR) repeat protein
MTDGTGAPAGAIQESSAGRGAGRHLAPEVWLDVYQGKLGTAAAFLATAQEDRELVRQLMVMAAPERIAAAVSDPRFHRRTLARMLALDVESALGDPARDARPAAELGATIAAALPRDPDGQAELRRAARLLAPELGYGRALYCQALARLRREQRRWEEALALAERAAALLDDYGSALEAGKAQIEQGWTLLDVGDPDEAVPLFEAALPLVESEQTWAVTGRLGLAVALVENGDQKGASRHLATADQLIAGVPQPILRLRLRWRGAQAARRCGQSGSALRRLCRVVPALLAQGEDHEAAAALLELLALCLERRWQQALSMTVIQEAIDALLESPKLPSRARAVFVFVAYVLVDPGPRQAAEVVAAAGRYLLDSRYRPDLPFRPLRARDLVHLAWDEIDPRVRAGICVEVGAEEETGYRSGKDLDDALRDFIAWRFEVLRRVRIGFPRGVAGHT